ncbi:STAS domain-containing protein [Myxococcus llanfairpwllgwyngyllgogerychwyrndrobwllllantysiliogogogochensis]|uniref:STAS domain-containing protein n=1 Tax=Myxococcus llanfairpwllgwyngyllgogerychwyrndrobwllllantysiliogogogochensis TaxID=2590453 RepID=A0A540X297_9BACT|nr:STAS domain-containing protein [Myxococcus llanfairpwllgwyngyllgogerychwyrndrobwllllantysiliogogogochensis]TQF15399.1 STAS domain-containing protein [Myxococcus llanfairpwllgwyngyllgogerychwyrndrobwllllantysiliogogogochensis]
MSHPDSPLPSRDLSRIPIIPLWGQLIVPLQGDITDAQAAQLCSDVLRDIQRTSAKGMVVDISGLWLVDSHLCAVLARLAASARLMGTRTVLCGMGADVALTLQSMGIQLDGVETALGLEEGLSLLGVRAVGARTAESEREEAQRLADEMLGIIAPPPMARNVV